MYGNEPISELGYSAVQSLYGGAPDPTYGALMTVLSFPNNEGFLARSKMHIDRAKHWPKISTSSSEVSPVPTVWFAQLSRESFWQEEVGRLGMAALRIPRYFVTTKTRRKNCFPRTYSTRMVPLSSFTEHAEARARVLPVLQHLITRNETWPSLRREWYTSSVKAWEQSIYSLTDVRRRVNEFKEAVMNRNERDANDIVIWILNFCKENRKVHEGTGFKVLSLIEALCRYMAV
jgi:hypothetical protein